MENFLPLSRILFQSIYRLYLDQLDGTNISTMLAQTAQDTFYTFDWLDPTTNGVAIAAVQRNGSVQIRSHLTTMTVRATTD